MRSEPLPAEPAPVAVPEAASERPECVFADCLAALEEAWRRGLPRDVPVRTMAPAILADPKVDARPAAAFLGATDIAAIEDALIAASGEIRDELRRRFPGEDAEDLALVAARAAMIELQNDLFAAAQLSEEDFHRPVAVIAAAHASPGLRPRFYYGVARLLAGRATAQVMEIGPEALPAVDEPAPPDPPLRVRLAYARPATLAYHLGRKLWDRLPFAGPRGSVLVLRENELLREAALHLMARGYAVRGLAMPRLGEAEPQAGDAATLVGAAVRLRLGERLRGLMAPTAVDLVAERGARLAVAAVARYEASLPHWRNRLDACRGGTPRAVLTNMLLAPEAVGLHRALRERGIPLVAFQHGVTAEICERNTRYGLSFENSAADLAVTFNQPMAELCRSNPAGRGAAIAAGLPRDYRRRTPRRHVAPAAVWYVRTTLFQSNLGRVHRGLSDHEVLLRETTLIDHVLARLPHKVIYKPYPAIRYLDPDPVLEHAAASSIEVFEQRLDLRYVVGRAGVLVTRGATSTLSWCLTSERPTVLINCADHMPLRAELVEPFDQALFLFDGLAADFHERLRTFLSRPLAEIDRAWRAKAAARRELLGTWLSTGHDRAGAAAADAIEDVIRARAS